MRADSLQQSERAGDSGQRREKNHGGPAKKFMPSNTAIITAQGMPKGGQTAYYSNGPALAVSRARKAAA